MLADLGAGNASDTLLVEFLRSFRSSSIHVLNILEKEKRTYGNFAHLRRTRRLFLVASDGTV